MKFAPLNSGTHWELNLSTKLSTKRDPIALCMLPFFVLSLKPLTSKRVLTALFIGPPWPKALLEPSPRGPLKVIQNGAGQTNLETNTPRIQEGGSHNRLKNLVVRPLSCLLCFLPPQPSLPVQPTLGSHALNYGSRLQHHSPPLHPEPPLWSSTLGVCHFEPRFFRFCAWQNGGTHVQTPWQQNNPYK